MLVQEEGHPVVELRLDEVLQIILVKWLLKLEVLEGDLHRRVADLDQVPLDGDGFGIDAGVLVE